MLVKEFNLSSCKHFVQKIMIFMSANQNSHLRQKRNDINSIDSIHTNINSSIIPYKSNIFIFQRAADKSDDQSGSWPFSRRETLSARASRRPGLGKADDNAKFANSSSPFLLLTCVLCIFADCTHRKERFSEICFTFADPLPPSHSLPNLTYFQALHPSSVWFKEMFLILKNPPVSTLLSCHTCWLYTA